MKGISVGIVLVALSRKVAVGQSGPNVSALKGLATVTTLSQTKEGRAALQANYDVTGSIQNGSVRLPTLLTFPEQQQQALRDATSTARNLAQLADGLACARLDNSRFNDPEANGRAYNATQTYSSPVVYSNTEQKKEDVSLIAPEAGYLLTSAYPSLSLSQADDLLTETEGPGGGFLDDGSSFGVYSRLNLYEAALRARAMDARNRESMQ